MNKGFGGTDRESDFTTGPSRGDAGKSCARSDTEAARSKKQIMSSLPRMKTYAQVV